MPRPKDTSYEGDEEFIQFTEILSGLGLVYLPLASQALVVKTYYYTEPTQTQTLHT